HGSTTAFLWAVVIFVLGFLLALVILPGRCEAQVPTSRAALARLAIGNCHHVEARDGTGAEVSAAAPAGGRGAPAVWCAPRVRATRCRAGRCRWRRGRVGRTRSVRRRSPRR